MKKFYFVLCLGALVVPAAFGAVAKKQSAIQNGTTVRAKVSAKGLYSQECYDEYYGCMDQFCISDNANGGSCVCSKDIAKYEKELQEINDMLAEAERVSTEEVEKIKLGANADIVFTGERKYDANGNVIKLGADKDKGQKRQDLLKMFEVNFGEDEDIFADDDNIANKTGAELFTAADEICVGQMDATCRKDMTMLRQIYQKQIDSDCKGFANSIATQRVAAESAMRSAQSDVRNALKESFDSANKYNQGECIVEFKHCMTGTDACGTDWENCVAEVASEKMQAKKSKKYKAKSSAQTTITASVMERLEAKRPICERVLDQCMAVRDTVWSAFLREIAPTLKLAESRAESKLRQSCLKDISDCIHTACRDNIAGGDASAMDSCLSRPTMARSFCKVQIEPCENMEPQIWEYVTDKLAAMRVDACTQEVKDCFTDENRCGPDFMNCIGMDYEFIRNICPIDKLVVCKKGKANFSMDDIDKMITGLYLNIDNKALENCQKLVEDKMAEICGSTSDCNRFAADDTIGTGSLRTQKDKNVYRVTGMISFGSIKVGDGATVMDGGKTLDVGEIGINEYMANATKAGQGVKNADAILDAIDAELKNISGTINRVVRMIELDPQIQFCVSGRDLEQITGTAGKTTARFPNLLNQVKTQIAVAALRQAQDNYNAKFNEYVTKATKDASADIAQYMCQMLPVSDGAPVGGTASETISLAPPYAISYEVGTGLNNRLLTQGGRGSVANGTGGRSEFGDTSGSSAVTNILLPGAEELKKAAHSVINLPNGTRELWSMFNRETRVCHFCTSTITKDCTTKQSSGFLGIGSKAETNCTESEPVEKCEDIEM
jgi:hypothetical protein